MNKNEFLYLLERGLGNINPDDRKEIIYDYEEHFRMGMQQVKQKKKFPVLWEIPG